MTAARQIELLSVEDYLAAELDGEIRHEYLGGYVYAMAGARTVHNRIAASWMLEIGSQLRRKPCEPFNSDMKIRLKPGSHTRFYYPDGMVVCEPNADDEAFQDKPVVVAEVLSESTRRIDEGEKREAYLTIPTLQTYMLIETDRPRVVVYRRAKEEFVAEAYDGTQAVVPLSAIGAELSLGALYERVEFAGEGGK